MYVNDDEEVIEWFESLENKLINLIYSKRELWFQNDMDMSDIENNFNSITRAFRGGKFQLVRVNIPKNKLINSQYSCNMYDETENIIPLQDLNETQHIIPILELQGIKFSARSFQVDIIGKQIMLLDNKPLFKSCLIKKSLNNTPNNLVESSPIMSEIECLEENSKYLTDTDATKHNQVILSESIHHTNLDETITLEDKVEKISKLLNADDETDEYDKQIEEAEDSSLDVTNAPKPDAELDTEK